MGSYLTLDDNLTVSDRKRLIKDAKGKAKAVSTKKLAAAGGEVVVRDLRPEKDLQKTDEYWEWSVGAADSFSSVLDTTVDDNKFVVIYGISNLEADPDTSFVKFETGARTLSVLNLSKAYTSDTTKTWVEEPIVYNQNSNLKMSFYSKSTGTKKIILHGVVAEKEGETVSTGPAK